MRSGEEYGDKEKGVLAFEDTRQMLASRVTPKSSRALPEEPPVEVPKTKTRLPESAFQSRRKYCQEPDEERRRDA